MINFLKLPCNILIFKYIIIIFSSFATIGTCIAKDNVTFDQTQHLYDRAKYHNTVGDYEQAIYLLNEAIKLKKNSLEDKAPEYFKIYNRFGIIYRQQGNLQRAIEYYNKALESTSEDFNQSVINGNIANIYSLKGDYLKAIDFYVYSLISLQNSNSKSKQIRIAENLHNQGYAYFKLGKYNLSKQKYLQSIKIRQEYKLNGIGESYYNCGLVYEKQDSLKKAEEYFTKGLETNTKVFGKNHTTTALTAMNLANFYVQLKQYSKANELFTFSYNSLQNTVGNKHLYSSFYHRFKGNMYLSMNKYDEALKCYQQSLNSKIFDFNDSSIYKNPPLKTIPDMGLIEILKGKSNALVKLSELENKEANFKAALSTLELTIKFIEQLRMGYLYEDSKLVLAEKEHETYTSIIKIAYELLNITGNNDYINVAFKYSERSKYAILRESMNEETARIIASIPENIQKQEEVIKEQIGNIRIQIENENKLVNPDSLKQIELKEKLFQLTQAQEKTIQELEQNYPNYYQRKYENRVVGITELQPALSEKEVFVSYEFTEKKLFAFIVTNNQYELSCVPIDSMFHQNLKIYSEFLHSEYLLSYKSFRISAYNLYKVLIEPLNSYMTDKNLLIAPNSQLSQISFESLATEPYLKKEYPDYRTVPYLIKKYPIGYVHSATLLVNSIKQNKEYNPNFLGFAPDYKDYRDSLNYLPELSVNLKKIARLLKGKIFVKEEATEQALKKHIGKFGILHLYTYGYGDTLNPSLSKMFFSYKNDTVEDGYLHTYEIDGLNINTNLIVLASCYSGSGAINKGEGTLSMGRSFMASGNPSILTSLWVAYVKPTLFEMRIFYKHLILGKRKDEALRLAKLKYLEETDNPTFTHPKFWTSLVVIGNQEALFKRYILMLCVTFAVAITILVTISIWIIKKRYKKG